MTEIEALLKNVKDLAIRQEEKSRSTGENFNVFKLCGVDHYENAHSDIIAEFLNPKGSHGCGSDFFQAFCKITGLDFRNYENAEVIREHWTDEGRPDMLIRAGKNKVVIENKIYANEQQDQLRRYRDWLDKDSIKKNESPLLFLTLDGRTSSDETVQGQYTPISYKNHIIPWLTECVRIAAEKPFVRESLLQYKKLVEELTKGHTMEIDKQLSAAIQGDFKSAIQVKNHIDQVKAAWLWDNIVKKLIENGFVADRDRNSMIADQDIFLSYEDRAKRKRVVYAFNGYGFVKPRREVISFNEKGNEENDSTTRNVPHHWEDNFFMNITPDNAEFTASEAIRRIIEDKDSEIQKG